MCLIFAGGKWISSPSRSSSLPGSLGSCSNSSNDSAVVAAIVSIILSVLGPDEQPVKELAGAAADFAQCHVETLLVKVLGRPALHQVAQQLKLSLGRGEAAFSMTRNDALPMIDGAVERRPAPQEIGIFPGEMPHLLDDVDSLGRIQQIGR